jgi:MerR family transcriptional regulator, heat shock protein HspR
MGYTNLSGKRENFTGTILVIINTSMKKQEKNTRTFLIGEVAKKLGISPESIRLYERKGLILSLKTGGNQRSFVQSDIERLECICTAINEYKISIEGIRRIQSLVPCWVHVQCSREQRMTCPAYHRSDAGCWTYQHKRNVCEGRDCHECLVYQLSGDCEKIKSLIHSESSLLSRRQRSRGKIV